MHQQNSIRRLLCFLSTTCVLGCGQSGPPMVQSEAAVAVDTLKSEKPTDKSDAPPAKGEPLANNGTFTFPDDTGGKLLAKLVTPSVPPALPMSTPLGPRERALPGFLHAPAPVLGDATGSPPRLHLPESKAVLPNALPERVPVDLAPPLPQLPERTALLTGPLTRDVGRAIDKPADLPFLSLQPIPDRASLADPTSEFTAQSVISLILPLRSETTGFLRFNLPDPFEHSETARPRTLIIDNPNRAMGNPPPPKP